MKEPRRLLALIRIASPPLEGQAVAGETLTFILRRLRRVAARHGNGGLSDADNGVHGLAVYKLG